MLQVLGGNGGLVTLNGFNGVSILGNITTTNGARLAAGTDYSLSRPGTLVLNTTNTSPGLLDGQGASSVFTIGDLEKNGGERGIRTLGTLVMYTRFPSVLLKPLGHLSI